MWGGEGKAQTGGYSDFDDRLKKAFDAAMAEGLYPDEYASTNSSEYFAEGAMSWFDGSTWDYRSREELKEYDPALASLLAEAFGNTDWRYSPPSTRTHLPHLEGFDPQDSPRYRYTARLRACYEQLFRSNGSCSLWVDLKQHNPSQLSHMRSPPGAIPWPSEGTNDTAIYFINQSDADVYTYFIYDDGREQEIGHSRVRPYGIEDHIVSVGSVFLIKDENNNNLALFRAKEKPGRAYFKPSQAKLVAHASDDLADLPQLQQNAPNPFNSQTVFSYFLPTASTARVDVFSITGQRVATLHHGPQDPGYHQLRWNGLDAEKRPVASGLYLYRLKTDFGILTRKLMLLR